MKLGKLKREDRTRWVKFHSIAVALRKTAEALDELAEREYGNGLAIIAIHSAIAYTDALTIAWYGERSVDPDHSRAVDVLVRALGQSARRQVKRLMRILDAKSHASYSGTYYTLENGQDILRDLQRYADWAEEMLLMRPG